VKITVGSLSTLKLAAVINACNALGLVANVGPVKTYSGQNEQPLDFNQTFRGALARARQAQEADPNSLAIGIENGIFCLHSISRSEEGIRFLDIAVIVAITPDGQQIIGTSTGLEFPLEYVMIASQRGFNTTTVGDVIAEKLGGRPDDPHSTLTKGQISRQGILESALVQVLKQIQF
jgi:non-canonical (house-cleaning) NTP pyrophosphatase